MTQRLLFGGTQGTASQSKYLVEFRAGKCTKNGSLVTPDKRKGLCYIHQTEDSLTHFCWKDRTTGQVEDDYILFPGDAEFVKVSQCTTGRAFVLKFNGKLCFYWMQEPKEDKDDDFKTKVNQLLNETPSRNNFADLPEENDISNLISGMSQRELASLFGNSSIPAIIGSVARERRRTAATNSGEDSMDVDPPSDSSRPKAAAKFQKRPHAARTTTEGEAGASSSATSNSNVQADSLLNAMTHSETLEPIINNSELMARVKDLLPQTEADKHGDVSSQIKMTVKSPQFQQAVSLFSAALMSGQMGPLMTQFGMSADVAAAAATGNFEEFIKALEKSQKKTSSDTEMK